MKSARSYNPGGASTTAGIADTACIAVARQPEPDIAIKRDHFTRVDAELLAWFNQN